ncbi:PREDICTED: ATP-binding cassette sub-family A member 6 [Dipodomys ordii]|uniref:ATP-binding cassette sub-family A member 6 n=1 Tax=Dipodomys ordii TaxID=10020 RepID=A0A1S3GVU4_DIPOR|nr:PREDICTED: ATP-binding cassette sub-family A member 6 [Dipodomys ordii]
MGIKQRSLYQQTRALLHKNLLMKWRMKINSLLEYGIPVLLGVYMSTIAHFTYNMHFSGKPPENLGRLDQFNSSSMTVVYMPISNTTQKIMNRIALSPFMKGASIIGTPNYTYMDDIFQKHLPYSLGIIFNDIFSYNLKVVDYSVPMVEKSLSGYCFESYDDFLCESSLYWKGGFVALQTLINAVIIEMTTNHSVMEELMSVTAINMRALPSVSKHSFQNEVFILFCLFYFISIIYFLSLNVTRERKKYKDLMKIMGLYDSAFWLSWGLLYAGFVFIFSIFITVIITTTQTIVMTGFIVIFTLFFLYGLSLIALSFLMSVLLQKAALTNFMMFLITLFWGCVGFTALYKQLPSSLEWILSVCSPFAFTSGMSQIIHQDYNFNGINFFDPSGESYVMIAKCSILVFDGVVYLLLALYFDKLLPYGSELHHSPLFFLNSSFCFQHWRTKNNVLEENLDPEQPSDDYFEPVAPELQGKEAIRIRNVKKEYKGKSGKVEALKGLLFDIYESQITAILGHKGAGKSSLLNIFTGLSVPTEGSVTIYNKNPSEIQDLEEIRKRTGVCLQHNVQFDILTLKENLRLFAIIKGIHPQEVEREVQQILLEFDMQTIQDDRVENLSEGQKRKLTFGTAILGDPQILILDEPTVGLDPFSRQQVWSFLKEHRANRVILFSTKYVDEADSLADRKVIMSHGKLKCAGSSIFLKRKWGIGYHLSLHRNEIYDPEKITSFIKHHIPEAELKTENKEKLVYTLPLERTSRFPDLLSDLDAYSGQGIMSCDISISTLNEVFMDLDRKSITEKDFEHSEMLRASEGINETEQACPSLLQMRKAVSDLHLWRTQVCAIAWLRFLKLKRERKSLLALLLILAIPFFFLIVELILLAVQNNQNWEFKTGLYFLSPGQVPQDLCTSLLIINNTGKHLFFVLQRFRLLLTIFVLVCIKDYRFSVVCNTKRLHCFPVLMNIISNGLLHMFNHTQYIQIKRNLFTFADIIIWFGFEDFSFLFSVVANISPYIAMSSATDYKKKADVQLWISGLYHSAYWFGQAVTDVTLFNFIIMLTYVIVYVTKLKGSSITSRMVFATVAYSFGYSTSLISLTYVISFTFCKRKKNSSLWSLCFCIFFIITVYFWTIFYLDLSILIPSMILIPTTSLCGYLFFVAERSYYYSRELPEVVFDIRGTDLLICLIPFFQTLVFIFVLRWMELKYGKKVIRKDPIFRIAPQSRDVHPNPEEIVDEDEDVQAERTRTSTALTVSNLNEKPIIIASSLHKEYAVQKKRCFTKSKKKIATRNISFCVNKGEILGLLGPSGAGKSSSIRMIAGITKPTAGEVELKGFRSVTGDQGNNTVSFLGYCPQENVLWPLLTTKEHLEVYAAVKGLQKGEAAIAISRLVNGFRLHDQLNVPVQKLTTGAARKLCFSVHDSQIILYMKFLPPSLIVVLYFFILHAIHFSTHFRQAIQTAVKNTEQCILLTTHNLTEAEALCDRVAIMVSGKLRCIGTIPHLKRKFGKEYILEVKVKEATQVPSVHMEIVKLFPQAAKQESCQAGFDLKSVYSAIFKFLKQNFNLEEYSLSQCTLEKVFLELSKEQELESIEEDKTMRWKHLSHSDEP